MPNMDDNGEVECFRAVVGITNRHHYTYILINIARLCERICCENVIRHDCRCTTNANGVGGNSPGHGN